MRAKLSSWALATALLQAAAAPAAAQFVSLQWIGSQKVEQIIGDVDWATGAPTASATYLNYKVLANGLGYSFEHFNRLKGHSELIFLFGDTAAFGTVSAAPGLDCKAVPVGALSSVTVNTCGASPSLTNFRCPTSPTDPTIEGCGKSVFDYAAQDPLAVSDSTDPEAGLVLRFLMNGDLPQFVTPSPLGTSLGPVAIATGGDDIPNSGIALGDQIYIVYSTGSNPSCVSPCDIYANAFSVLVQFDEGRRSFTTLRELSSIPAGGHFLYTTMHEVGPGYGGTIGRPSVLVYGTGDYRQSNIYLALIPREHFADGIGTQYLTGLDHGRPVWTTPAKTTKEAMDEQTLAQPVIVDDAPSPSIGNISVGYVPSLDLWLMTYNADGEDPPATRSVFLRYASGPWGPWSAPLTIFNDCADGAFGTFVHYYADTSSADCPRADPYPAGVAGPMISENGGANDPQTSRGGSFAPSIIERFTRIRSGVLSIYYTLSTWNPYTVVRMRSDFKIVLRP